MMISIIMIMIVLLLRSMLIIINGHGGDKVVAVVVRRFPKHLIKIRITIKKERAAAAGMRQKGNKKKIWKLLSTLVMMP